MKRKSTKEKWEAYNLIIRKLDDIEQSLQTWSLNKEKFSSPLMKEWYCRTVSEYLKEREQLEGQLAKINYSRYL